MALGQIVPFNVRRSSCPYFRKPRSEKFKKTRLKLMMRYFDRWFHFLFLAIFGMIIPNDENTKRCTVYRYTDVYRENSERPLAVDWGGPRMRHAARGSGPRQYNLR
jgi:hypothetical protein